MVIADFVKTLEKQGISFYTGVPDSYLNGFNNYLREYIPVERNIITANEGNAIALASGYYFATGELPLVYMQNSGLGNCINPLLSLTDKHVYSVPMILLLGWRGEPGTKDGEREQHIMQGKVTGPLLDTLEIPYHILSEKTYNEDICWAVSCANDSKNAVALISPSGILTEKKKNVAEKTYPLSREDAINIVLDTLPGDTIYCATTGRATRELYCLRDIRGEGHEHDFLNIGSMGHASSVAMGIAIERPNRRVVCLDGDAAAIMHMGAMTTVSKLKIPNFMHIILNNGVHESVGNQPSAGQLINFTAIAQGCGYYTIGHDVSDSQDLISVIQECEQCKEASFIDVKIHSGIRDDLKAIDMSSNERIEKFIEEVR